MSGIVCEVVHGPANERLLSLERSSRRRVLFRQPRERCDLRMIHAIGYEQLLAFTVIRHRFGLSEFQAYLVRRRAADDTQWGHVSIGLQRKNHR